MDADVENVTSGSNDSAQLEVEYENAHYHELLASVTAKNIVIIDNHSGAKVQSNNLARRYPKSKVYLAKVEVGGSLKTTVDDVVTNISVSNIQELKVVLAALGSIDVIIDQCGLANNFDDFFLLVNECGLYLFGGIADIAHGKGEGQLTDKVTSLLRMKYCESDTLQKNKKMAALSSGIERLVHWGDFGAAIRSMVRFYKKIREEDAKLFYSFYPPSITPVPTIFHASFDYQSNGSFHSNRSEFQGRFKHHYKIPEMKVRAYRNVVCVPGQVVLDGDCVLPESFRMPLQKNPQNRHLKDIDNFYTYDRFFKPEVLEGTYIHFDSEYSHHFGHITAEVISKLWCWNAITAEDSSVKILVGLPDGKRSPILDKLLELYDIPLGAVVGYDKPVVVENLICPSQSFHISRYASPIAQDIWSTIAKNAYVETIHNGKKVFLSRPIDMSRGCKNQLEVEQIFEDAGYVVIYPEQFSLVEQISICSTAKEIAGFAGSATLNAIYGAENCKKIIICSETFTADNDILISSVKGGDLHYFWCDADVQHPKNGWSVQAYTSSFTFDMRKDGLTLLRAAIK
jgi:capsular polysaccharide biosynthesis protein